MNRPLAALEGMTYPGRLILIGLNHFGEKVVVAYAITGRSPSSQARRLRLEGQSIWTEPTEREILRQGREELLIYRAIVIGEALVVANGRHIEDIVKVIGRAKEPEGILQQGLKGWTFEPDAPHFTPRISGCVLAAGSACLSLLRKRKDGKEERSFFSWILEPGWGKMIATYRGQERNPLPAFDGDPLDLPIAAEDAPSLAEDMFDSLAPIPPAPDYRVAVACVYASIGHFHDFEAHIINKGER